MADLGQSSHLDKELVTKIAENLKARQNKNKETFSKHKRVYNDEEDFAVNEKNRFYNKQLSKYYDKYNADVRASIERGGGL